MKRVRVAVKKGDLIRIGDDVEFQLAEDGVGAATIIIEIPDDLTVKRKRPLVKAKRIIAHIHK